MVCELFLAPWQKVNLNLYPFCWLYCFNIEQILLVGCVSVNLQNFYYIIVNLYYTSYSYSYHLIIK